MSRDRDDKRQSCGCSFRAPESRRHARPRHTKPPPADHQDAWRAAVLAYRRIMQTEGDDWHGRRAAIDAYLAARPEDGRDEAERQVTRAIVWAATHHTAWFWRGVRYGGRKPAPPTGDGGATG